jgi:hypothetical protein
MPPIFRESSQTLVEALVLPCPMLNTDFNEIANHVHQQCEESHWLARSKCSNPAALGVGVRRHDGDYSFSPSVIAPSMVAAIRSIGLPVAFTMSSDITATVFAQISPHQNEIIIQPRGVRIPVISSLKLVPSRAFEIKQSLACLVREEKIVLLCANAIEGAVTHGSDVEQMLMETVRLQNAVEETRG